MVGQIDISPDGSCLLISFPYRPDLVEVVKTIPGRRWDRGSRTWKVPIGEVELTVKTFMAHGFRLSPDVATALASGGESKDLGTMQLQQVQQDSPALTISALNLRVAEVLSQNFKEHVWVIGEIQSYKAKGRSKHKYFELVERDEDELQLEVQTRAVVEAVIFDSNLGIINKRLRSAATKIALEDGLKVRVRGKVDLFQPRGKYQFVIDDIDPAYTLGDMLIRREKILAELDKLGVREQNLAVDVPRVPLRVALVTSFESEAYNDFVQSLAGSGFNFEITVFDVFVQGDQLQQSVVEALESFRDSEEDFDVLVITRGGGSRSELGAWDDIEVAKAVATHPLKVIVGIGHERDQSVLDMIAHSVKTPTAAAEMLLERARVYQEHVEDAMLEIADKARRILRDETRELRQKALALRQAVRAGMAGSRSALHEAHHRLERGSKLILRDASRNLLQKAGTIQRSSFRRLDAARFVVDSQKKRIGNATKGRLERESRSIEAREARARAVDPVRVLARGFTILRADGKAIRSVKDTKKGQSLEAQLTDGRLAVQVETVTSEPRNT